MFVMQRPVVLGKMGTELRLPNVTETEFIGELDKNCSCEMKQQKMNLRLRG